MRSLVTLTLKILFLKIDVAVLIWLLAAITDCVISKIDPLCSVTGEGDAA